MLNSVVLFLHGGADTYNILVPHSNCAAVDLYAEYSAVRGDLSLTQSELLSISVPSGSQPCDTFGIHPKLPLVQQLYADGDLAWIANVGALAEPISKEEVKSGTKVKPLNLFAHNSQRRRRCRRPGDALGRSLTASMH